MRGTVLYRASSLKMSSSVPTGKKRKRTGKDSEPVPTTPPNPSTSTLPSTSRGQSSTQPCTSRSRSTSTRRSTSRSYSKISSISLICKTQDVHLYPLFQQDTRSCHSIEDANKFEKKYYLSGISKHLRIFSKNAKDLIASGAKGTSEKLTVIILKKILGKQFTYTIEDGMEAVTNGVPSMYVSGTTKYDVVAYQKKNPVLFIEVFSDSNVGLLRSF